MEGEDLFCCLINNWPGYEYQKTTSMFWWMAWLKFLALSDVEQKISVLIYLFAEKATINSFVFFLNISN